MTHRKRRAIRFAAAHGDLAARVNILDQKAELKPSVESVGAFRAALSRLIVMNELKIATFNAIALHAQAYADSIKDGVEIPLLGGETIH